MTIKRDAKKLQLHAETLRRLAEADAVDGGGESDISRPGCTVDTTCSPGCCDTVDT